tara:strand:- start:2144 stop:2386 length:243 start_codon:yes stop_codon:yes gene_type:complete
MNNKTYAIINISDLDLIDFSQINETSNSTIRKSIDEINFVIKYEITPTFISNGTIIPSQILNHSDCFALMQTTEWNGEIN